MTVIEIVEADITKQELDAIVNAANSKLRHGGGVAKAIAVAAGPQLEEDSRARPFVPTGEATWTRAGELPCKVVIHAVGPIWRGGEENEPQLLASAYRSSVALAAELGLKSIGFPSISTGIYGFPIERAAAIAIGAVKAACDAAPTIELVRFCLFSERDLGVFKRAREIER